MNKRQFLKTSGALLGSEVWARLAGAVEPGAGQSTAEKGAPAKPAAAAAAAPRTNWAGNYTFRARRLDLPQSLEEVQALVRRRSPLKALGARHSFNDCADTTGDQISLQNFDSMSVDAAAGTVTVGGGVTYGKLAPFLDSRGFALHNLASLPHVSVAGACSTGTHGSGNTNGNLSTAVAALELVTASGDIVHLSRQHDGDEFPGAVVSLGGLGVITKLTLDVQPTYQARQVVYENMSMDHLEHHLDAIFASGYSVSLFTDWQNHNITQVWIKSRVEPDTMAKIEPEFFGARAARRDLHPLAGHSAENCTPQMGVPGPWYERLPHFRMNFTPSSGAELQTEYFVPRERGYEAVLAVEKLRDHITPHLYITELRTIAADRLWISQCSGRDSMAIHFTWKPEWPEVRKVLPLIEAQLEPFGARPHWAKLYTIPAPRLKSLYTQWADFRRLVGKYDSQGKFRNEYLNSHIFAA